LRPAGRAQVLEEIDENNHEPGFAARAADQPPPAQRATVRHPLRRLLVSRHPISRRLLVVALLVVVLVPTVTVADSSAPAGAAASKTTICHRTRSATNPYRRITVARSAVTSNQGHRNHTGELWSEGATAGWGDIIPDASSGGSDAAQLNFTAAGRAIWDGTTKSGGVAACRYQSARQFYDLQKAAGATDQEIVDDLNDQQANEDVALLRALGGAFTVANLDSLEAVSATTTPATGVASTSATLNGTIAPGAGTSADLSFVYGTAPDLVGGTVVPATPSSFTGSAETSTAGASATLTGLPSGTTHYFRLVGTTDAGLDTEGTLEGAVLSFTTPGTAPQTIDFAQPPDATVGDGPIPLTASASSTLPVTVTSLTPAVCTVTGLAVLAVAAGTCTLEATQPGDPTFAPAAPVQRGLQVAAPAPAPQTVSLPPLPQRVVTDAPFAVVPSASSGLTATLSSLTPAVCAVSGVTVALVAAGTCTLAADQPGDADHLPAVQVTASFAVVRALQTVDFPQPADVAVGDGPVAVIATASSGLPVTLTSLTPAVCTVAGPAVTPVAPGTCSLEASQPGGETHAPAEPTVVRSFAVTAAAAPESPAPTPTPTPTPTQAPAPAPAPAPVTVPPAPGGAVEFGSATSASSDGRAVTAAGPLSSAASGAGGITVARLGGVPERRAPGADDGDYFTVALGRDHGFAQVELRLEDPEATSLLWWTGEDWRKLEGTRREAGSGALVVVLAAGTRPGLDDLSELRLAGGETPAARVGAPDRTGTAVAASRSSYPRARSARAVVLARDDVYADALTGGPLAGAVGAPLLLSEPARLSPATAAELRRVLAPDGTVHLLGGTDALSAAVADEVAALGYAVERVAGGDRYGTAVAIARRLGDPGVIFEATGRDFPDAVSAGPAAISAGGAVLLTEGAEQAPATRAYLEGRDVVRYAVGGQAVAADPAATAVAGDDRYATSAEVAQRFFDQPEAVGLAVGDAFPDSLVAAPQLGRTRQPLLLVDRDALPDPITGYLTARSAGIGRVTAFGGSAALSETVLRRAQEALP